MRPPRTIPYYLPSDLGAGWTFTLCIASGLALALARGGDSATAWHLAAGLLCLFLASDWLTDAARVALNGRWLRPAPMGLFLTAGGLALCAQAVWRAGLDRPLGLMLWGGLVFWAFMACLVMALRLVLPPRSLGLLLPSAVLVSAPAMLLPILAFGDLDGRVAGFWAAWAAFFALEVVYVQTWLSGAQLPCWRLTAASLAYLGAAALLALWGAPAPAGVLLLLCLRVLWRLRQRTVERSHLEAELEGREQPAHLPTDPDAISRFGWEQLAWSLALGLLWTWRHWP
jgi:hypothetical protein